MQVLRGNESERDFLRMAWCQSWKATKRGWPDFLCKDKDGLFVVEVKRRLPSGKTALLRREQVEVLEWFSRLGIRCFISDGRSMEPYDKKIHGSDERRRRSQKERAH